MPTHWNGLKTADPGLAKIGEERLHGRIAYLSTVRKDGSPRVFPVMPFTDGHSLWLFVGATSPKRFDLVNDGRYAMHCGVEDPRGGSGEFHLTGTAVRITDPPTRDRAVHVWTGLDPVGSDYLLFELLVSSAVHTVYTDRKPVRRHWPSSS